MFLAESAWAGERPPESDRPSRRTASLERATDGAAPRESKVTCGKRMCYN